MHPLTLHSASLAPETMQPLSTHYVHDAQADCICIWLQNFGMKVDRVRSWGNLSSGRSFRESIVLLVKLGAFGVAVCVRESPATPPAAAELWHMHEQSSRWCICQQSFATAKHCTVSSERGTQCRDAACTSQCRIEASRCQMRESLGSASLPCGCNCRSFSSYANARKPEISASQRVAYLMAVVVGACSRLKIVCP